MGSGGERQHPAAGTTATFDIEAPNHQVFRARELARYTIVNLQAEFGQVVFTAELID